MSRMIKFIWLVSIVLFLLVLLWVYAYLPLRVGVLAGPEGVADTFITKESFFYISLGIFILVNGILFILRRLIVGKALPQGRPAMVQGRLGLYADLADWLLGFAAALNFFFIFGMAFLSVFNNPEGIEMSNYWLVVYGGPVLIGFMLIALIYLFFKRRS